MLGHRTHTRGATPLPINLRNALDRLVQRDGLPSVAARLGSSKHGLARALGGLPVRRVTALLVERVAADAEVGK